MSEPAKENPKTSKRSKRRPAMEPLGWDEIVSQPGMGGYLSFLNGPVPLPHLQGASTTGPAPAPGVDPGATAGSIPEDESIPVVALDPPPLPASAIAPAPVVVSVPDVDSHSAGPKPAADPGTVSNPSAAASPRIPRESRSTPEVVLIPAVTETQRLRIRRCHATHDGHSLGEEVLYQALWKAAQPESGDSRTIVIGWRGMSQLCRMTPKNCKINTQRLIRKLALEILSPYNTPESIGTTYRVYSDQNILLRRREAGLEWVVRSRGVDFVDPATGASIMPICAHTH